MTSKMQALSMIRGSRIQTAEGLHPFLRLILHRLKWFEASIVVSVKRELGGRIESGSRQHRKAAMLHAMMTGLKNTKTKTTTKMACPMHHDHRHTLKSTRAQDMLLSVALSPPTEPRGGPHGQKLTPFT
jgi:hypothetical protein